MAKLQVLIKHSENGQKYRITMNKEKQTLIRTEYLNDTVDKGIANESFKGPSLYFSQEALTACKEDFLGKRHLEMVYATLVSWGMHRSGNGGAKMPGYDSFCKSIIRNKNILNELRSKRVEALSCQEWDATLDTLRSLIFDENGILASTTKAKVVSGSKTLAHIIPDIMPPIDRQYTATFFGFDKYNLSNKKELSLFDETMELMRNLYTDKEVLRHAVALGHKLNLPLPKLVDNAIIKIVNDEIQSKKND